MSASGQKDKFQERLDRINAARGGQGADNAPPDFRQPPKSGKSGGGGGRGRGAGRLVGFVLMGAVALSLVGGGVYAAVKLNTSLEIPLKKTAMDLLSKMVARTPTIESHDGLLSSGPKERKQRDTGWELPSPYVAAQGRSDLTLDMVAVTQQSEAPQANAPDVQSFDLNQHCTLRRPDAGEVVRNVRLEDTARYTHMHMFSKEELAKAVAMRIEGITSHAKNYKNAAIAEGRMGQVDVFVTDTSAPVYLVLQSFNRDILWNIQLADGVTLAHVALIGNKSGFAAPKGDFSYEALRIEDFVEENDLYRNEESRPCMIAPWRMPEQDWPLIGKLDHPIDASTYRNQLRTFVEGYAAFDSWYVTQLGVDAHTNLTSAKVAAHALSGPIPLTPVQQIPISAQTLYVAQNDYVAFGNAQLDGLHKDLLLLAAGGDLSILNPPPMEASPQ